VDYGNPCVETETPWIGRCDYDAAYEILNHIHGNLTVICPLFNLCKTVLKCWLAVGYCATKVIKHFG